MIFDFRTTFDVVNKSKFRLRHIVFLLVLQVAAALDVTTFAGDDDIETSNGSPSDAEFNYPRGFAFTGNGNDFYFVDEKSAKLRFYDESNNYFSTVAGSSEDYIDGEGTNARFNEPMDVAFDQVNSVTYIADFGNNAVRRYDPNTNYVTTVVGDKDNSGHIDGFGVDVHILKPYGLDFSPDGSILWLATERTIRSIDISNYEVNTLYDQGSAGTLRGVAAGPDNVYIYFIDEGRSFVGKVAISDGSWEVAAGGLNMPGDQSGYLASARFDSPLGITYVPQTNSLYVADSANFKIKQVDLSDNFAYVSTLAGSTSGHQDGTSAGNVKFKCQDIGFNPNSNELYVHDDSYIRIIEAGLTWQPTASPTKSPTLSPSLSPSKSPTQSPSLSPSNSPTLSPTLSPSASPTKSPSKSPTMSPTLSPSMSPSSSPTTLSPSNSPSSSPTTFSPSVSPSTSPTLSPSLSPTLSPTVSPTASPSTVHPSTVHPSTVHPSTVHPSTDSPSMSPSLSPTISPTNSPSSYAPSISPTISPSTHEPTLSPSMSPSSSPSTSHPSTVHPSTDAPSLSPSTSPSISPTSDSPTSVSPSMSPSISPTVSPSSSPSTSHPSTIHPLTNSPTFSPSYSPSISPSMSPSRSPTMSPSGSPATTHPYTTHPSTDSPTLSPSCSPSASPSTSPSVSPTISPSSSPSTIHPYTVHPSTNSPTLSPSWSPSLSPSMSPSASPTKSPSCSPSSAHPSTTHPSTDAPTLSPSISPSASPTSVSPSLSPSVSPSMSPTMSPSSSPSTTHPYTTHPSTNAPTFSPSTNPSCSPSTSPSYSPTVSPQTVHPYTTHPSTQAPTLSPSSSPSLSPSGSPSISPSLSPSVSPSYSPSTSPQTMHPYTTHPSTYVPSRSPSVSPSISPSKNPSVSPTASPLTSHPFTTHPTSLHPITVGPTLSPSICPSVSPSASPSISPSKSPSKSPSITPTASPQTAHPHTSHPSTGAPTLGPTLSPTTSPTISPTVSPTDHPGTAAPSFSPSKSPTFNPTTSPTKSPSPHDVSGLSVTLNGPQIVGKCTTTQLSAVITATEIDVGITWWANGIELTNYNTAQIAITYDELQSIVGAIPDNSNIIFSVQVYQISEVNSQTYFSETDAYSVTYVEIEQPAVSVIPVPGIISPSSNILLEGNIQYPQCTSTGTNIFDLHLQDNAALTYTWEIEDEDANNIILENNYDSLSLSISPNTLPSTQTLTVRLTVSGLESLYGISQVVATTTIKTGISDVVAKLSCGANNQISTTSTNFIDASGSYDPAELADTISRYQWACTGACWMTLPGDGSASSVTFPENTLSPGITFTLTMTYKVLSSNSDQDRENTAQCTFQTVSSAVPKVVIKADSVVAAGQSIKMQTDATPHPLSPASSAEDFTYSWYETEFGFDMSSISTATVVLAPSLLSPGNTYNFHVEVTDTLTQTTSSASMTIILRAEASVNIDINPSIGFEYLTRFTIACVATVPEGGAPIEYQLMDTIGDTDASIVRDWGGICQKTTLFKEGEHAVSVRVRDAYGSVTVVDANNNVNVSPSPPRVCGGLSQADELLGQLLSEYGLNVQTALAPGRRIFQEIDLLSQIAAHGAVIFAAAEILGNLLNSNDLQLLDGTILENCIADSGYSSAEEYEGGLWDRLFDVLETAISQQGTVYTDSATQGLLTLIRSPLSPTDPSESILNQAMDMVNTLRDISTASSLTSGFGRKLSTCIDALAQSGGSGTLVSNSLNMFLSTAANSLIPGEQAVDYTADTFSASVSVAGNDFFAPSIGENGVSVVLQDVDDSTEMNVGIIKWNEGYPKNGPQIIPNDFSLQSSIVDVTLTNANGTNIQIRPDIDDIGYIDITIDFNDATSEDLECQYYNHDINEWDTEGCEVYERGDLFVTCRCTHLTEFAVMARHKEGEVLPTHVMKIAYLCSAAISGILFVISTTRLARLSWTLQHKTWVGFIHACMSLQTLTRTLSSILFSGIASQFSLTANPILVYVIAALPYTFWFLMSSLITFQWMSMTFSRILRKDPFRKYKKWYFLSCALCTLVVWTSLALVWFANVQEMAIFGSAFIAACCIILLVFYTISGYKMHSDMSKAFKLMDVSSNNAKRQKKTVNAANKMRNIAISVSCGFPILSIIWVVSVTFSSPVVLDVVVPLFLLLDALIVVSILVVYRKSVISLSKSRSTSGGTGDSSRHMRSLMIKSNNRRSSCNPRASDRFRYHSPTLSMSKRRYSSARKSPMTRNTYGPGSTNVSVVERKTRRSRVRIDFSVSREASPNQMRIGRIGTIERTASEKRLTPRSISTRALELPSPKKNETPFSKKRILNVTHLNEIKKKVDSQDGESVGSNEKKSERRASQDDENGESVTSSGSKSETDLPTGWSEHFTLEGQAYYYNADTKQSSWKFPSGKTHTDDNKDLEV